MESAAGLTMTRGVKLVAATLRLLDCRRPIMFKQFVDRWRVTQIPKLALLTFGAFAGPADAAFCFSESRVISDDEFIESAVIDAARSSRTKIAIKTSDDARDFIAQNPGCCKLLSHEHPFADFGLLALILGIASETVQVIMPTDRRSAAGVPLNYHAYVSLDRCAKAVERTGIEEPISKGLDE